MAGWLGQAGWLACYPGLCLQRAGEEGAGGRCRKQRLPLAVLHSDLQ